MNGPQTYTKLSSVAENFINASKAIERPTITKQYEYIGDGANLQIQQKTEESKIHRFLGISPDSEKVKEEFGNAIDIIA